MAMTKKDIFALTAGAILLVMVTAGASAYYFNESKAPEDLTAVQKSSSADTNQNRDVQNIATAPPPPPPAQAQIPACDDDNIVGKVVGGAAGGLLGSQVGKGSGKTAATIGGSVGGTLLGEEFVPTRNVTCR